MRVHMLGGAKQLRRTCNPFWKHDPNFLVRNQRAFLIFLLFRQSFSDFLWCFNAFARGACISPVVYREPREDRPKLADRAQAVEGPIVLSSCAARMNEERLCAKSRYGCRSIHLQRRLRCPETARARQGGSIEIRSTSRPLPCHMDMLLSNEEMKSEWLRVW
jgi:hypothetical protein